MGSLTLEKFLIYLELETGGIVVGVLDFLWYGISLVYFLYYLELTLQVMDMLKNLDPDMSSVINFTTTLIVIFVILFFALAILSCLLLIRGTRNVRTSTFISFDLF